MIFLSESDVRALLPMPEAIRQMRAVFQALDTHAAQNQSRRRLTTPAGATLHQLAGAFGNYYGAKIYSTHVRHGAWFLFLLYDAATARPLALMEANHLGQIRTGAVTGLATDLLARAGAHVLGVIGSGFQAYTQVEAVAAVRKLDRVLVYSRKPGGREEFAAQCREQLGLEAHATTTAQEAIADADIIATATYAKDPVLESAWVRDGAHVNAVGSNQPTRRELPGELVQRAAMVVTDSIEQSRMEAGDLLLGLHDWSKLLELQSFQSWPARDPKAVTVFKSVGLGVEDVAAAGFVYERAVECGRGAPSPLFAAG